MLRLPSLQFITINYLTMKWLLMLTIIALTLNYERAKATNLRGQLVRNIGGTYRPLANVRVDFMVWNGTGWAPYSYAITGGDGFYYFLNFSPGLKFCVAVLGHYYPNQPLTIQNLSPQFYQDIPAIAT